MYGMSVYIKACKIQHHEQTFSQIPYLIQEIEHSRSSNAINHGIGRRDRVGQRGMYCHYVSAFLDRMMYKIISEVFSDINYV